MKFNIFGKFVYFIGIKVASTLNPFYIRISLVHCFHQCYITSELC